MSDQQHGALATYLNPVYPRSFPDPFVLKFGNLYFAYCTDFAEDGNVFGVLRSPDLVNWTRLGGAMKRLEPSPPFYWAPEVTYDNGKFYLYYSVGNETLMELRVAVSESPDHGFVDSGHRLTSEEFAIDAHVFVDDDGEKYLFYATDFLEHTHVGTGTVVDRMVDWFTLAGDPHPVTRAKYDWQVYDPNRKEKGGVRWHTVEGPTVLKRKGLYYEMFSGGNWQNTTYGVSFATSDRISTPNEWLQHSDGEGVLPILRTEPGVIIGPGHNCVVRGPNNRELFCVYHRWTENGRVLAIDRMDFAGDRIFVTGATHTEQPAPFAPQVDAIDPDDPRWSKSGDWTYADRQATCTGVGTAEARLGDLPPSFLCEVTVRCADRSHDSGRFEVRFEMEGGPLGLTFQPASNRAQLESPDSRDIAESFRLPADFDWMAAHVLRIEADHRKFRIRLDAAVLSIDRSLSQPVEALVLRSESQSVVITSFQLTSGFVELFEDSMPLSENGWHISPDAAYRVDRAELLFETGAECSLQKGASMRSFEFAANFRSLDRSPSQGIFGLDLRDPDGLVLRFAVNLGEHSLQVDESTHPLPPDSQLSDHHQLRLLKLGGRALCYFDDVRVGEIALPDAKLSAAIFGRGAPFAVEMVRLTEI